MTSGAECCPSPGKDRFGWSEQDSVAYRGRFSWNDLKINLSSVHHGLQGWLRAVQLGRDSVMNGFGLLAPMQIQTASTRMAVVLVRNECGRKTTPVGIISTVKGFVTWVTTVTLPPPTFTRRRTSSHPLDPFSLTPTPTFLPGFPSVCPPDPSSPEDLRSVDVPTPRYFGSAELG